MDSILSGKVFISTRPSGKSKELQLLFEKEGASVIELPMIDLSVIKNNPDVEKTISRIDNYNYIAFTSANAFHFFIESISHFENPTNLLNKLRIVSIGYNTSEEIKAKGFNIEYDANAKTGKEFAEKLCIYFNDKKATILWPTGDLSPNHLVRKLKPIAEVSRLNVYTNSIPENINESVIDKIKNNKYDMIILASPSAFNNLVTLVSNQNFKSVCIGETTAEATMKQGITPLTIAKEPNAIGIFNAVYNYYKNL